MGNSSRRGNYIFGPDRANEHDVTRFAEIHDEDVIYPAADDGS